jgi:hypothetical protein
MREFPDLVEIRFVAGFDRGPGYPRPPRCTRDAGLTHRLAVIQETHVEGSLDMVFDEMLWMAVIDYASRFCTGGVVTIAESVRDVGQRERPLADCLEQWERSAADDRCPPELLLVRTNGALELCVVTELWAHVGGPQAYHDSYTYVLYAKRDLSAEVPAFLRARPEASRWSLMPVQPPADEPSFWQRLLGRS